MTAKNTKIRTSIRRIRSYSTPAISVGLFITIALHSGVARAADELVDRIVATVGKQALTLREVERNHALDSLVNRGQAIEPLGLRKHLEDLEKAREAAIQNVLIQTYLDATGFVLVIDEARRKAIEQRIHSAFPSNDAERSHFSALGISEAVLAELIRGRLRAEAFRDKLIPARLSITDAEVRSYYEREKDRRFLGKPLESIHKLVREDYRRERLKKEFEQWLEAETRRTEIVRLPLQPLASHSEPSTSTP